MRLEYRPKKQLFVTALLLVAISAVCFLGSTICLPYLGYLTGWAIDKISACVIITFVVVFFLSVFLFFRRYYSKKESLLSILFLTPVASVVAYLYVGFFVLRYRDRNFVGETIEIRKLSGYDKGLANKYGQTIINPEYGRIIKRDGKAFLYAKYEHSACGIYDLSTGQMLVNGPLFDNGIIVENSDGKKGISSLDGWIIVPPIYDKIERLNGLVFQVEMNGFYGMLDCMGDLVVSPNYVGIKTIDYDRGYFYVLENRNEEETLYSSDNGVIHKMFDTRGEIEAVLDSSNFLVSEDGSIDFVSSSGDVRTKTNMKYYEIDRANKTVKLWSYDYSDYVLYNFNGHEMGN